MRWTRVLGRLNSIEVDAYVALRCLSSVVILGELKVHVVLILRYSALL
jgi:hypothetical protein